MKPLGYAPEALADLEAITHYIARDNPHRAISFVAELRAKAARIAEAPAMYPSRDDLAKGIRSARHGRYLILFRELIREVRVVRVAHQAQNLPALFR